MDGGRDGRKMAVFAVDNPMGTEARRGACGRWTSCVH